jgi:serine/threonine protein kinase/Tol biopolymer transport system component
MSLSPGSRLGPYEILSPLGAGGMGEVYRARDPRLSRDVAIKILPASFSGDPDRLRRFEQEARSASALNHPNIITIHDIGSSDSTFYIAMEFVDGTSLRELTAGGPLPTKRLFDVGVQIAEGLAKAHAAGIVHRDLKPENIMVSKDGFVKILDFGLAKLFVAPQEQASGLPTAIQQETQPGTVMGTVGYMSPEQASGKSVDFRSDQFSLGSILYEMATGKRAFQRGTGAETLTAIIKEEPEPVERVNPRAPAPFRWIVERCLAKDPDERYASTRDLARDLKSVREHISEVSVSGATAPVEAPRSRAPRLVAFGAALLAAGLIAGVSLDRRLSKVVPPSFRQLTFRRGEIHSARFAPDGQTVIYTAAWDGKPMEIFFRRLESPESRPSGLAAAELLAVSASGEMAVSLNRRPVLAFVRTGRLASTSIAGGAAPREILEDVQWADWAPDGKEFAIVRDAAGRNRLEFPVGKALYETTGWISHPRISRSGDLVAFCDHPAVHDDSGSVAVVDRAAKKRTISGSFSTLQGLAWSPNGGEVWFTAAEVGANRSLHAVTLSGRHRVLAGVTGSLTLRDVGNDGRLLITHDTGRQGIIGLAPGETKERELSWLDYSSPRDLSSDGKTLLFDESGEGGGEGYSVYIRKTDGSPATRLGEGAAARLSPDGKWALSVRRLGTTNPQIVVYPTGVGEPRPLPSENLKVGPTLDWLPDGKTVVFTANEPGHGTRIYLRPFDGGKARPLTPEGYRGLPRAVSPDGRTVATIGPDQRFYLYPIAGGEPTPVPAVAAEDRVEGWSADGKSIFVHRRGELPARIYRLDVATGKKTLWKETMPLETAGLGDVGGVIVTPDGRSYVFGTGWTLSDLYLVEGLK